MLIDRPQVVEGSSVINLTVPSGTADPTNPNVGELFFRTDLNALRTFGQSGSWAEAGQVNLNSHMADYTVHLTSGQNAWIDAITATSTEVNYLVGVTSSVQTQIDTRTSLFDTHVADYTVHLTSAQNTWIDAITASSTEVNYLVGVTGSVQTQLNSIYTLNSTQDSRLSTLENTTVPTVQTNLNVHSADDSRHLTPAQNTLLDATISNGIVAADIAKLSGAAGLSSSIKSLLDGLEANKLARDGSQAMSGDLSLAGNRITNLATPTAATDAVTKDYVDSFVQGLHWVGSAKCATIGNIALTGLQTIDGYTTVVSDRVLVKNQNTPAENGIYLAATGAWTRADDYNALLEINNSAVFVLNGTTQNKSTWVQTATVTTIGTSAISFSAFSGPVVNTAGPGIALGSNGSVSVVEGAGIAFDGNNAMIVDLYPSGGLMLTTNGTTAAAVTTSEAQVALTNTGVSAGTYQSATTITPFTVDAKGRLTSVGTTVTITPAFSSITGLPTTVGGYGITNAVLKTGDTMTGDLMFSGGMVIRNSAPTASNSWFGTPAYGTGQGDNKTHIGYYNGSTWVNYLRGATTYISGTLAAEGASTHAGAASFSSTVSVAGTTTLAGASATSLAVNGATSLNGTLTVTGTTTLPSSLIITRQGTEGGEIVLQKGTAQTSLSGDVIIDTLNTQVRFFENGGSFRQFVFDLVSGGIASSSQGTFLSASNYNSYAPTLTGTGASGTWGISITGNAGSVGTFPVTNLMRNLTGAAQAGADWHALGQNLMTVQAVLQEAFNVNATTSSGYPTNASYKYGTLMNIGSADTASSKAQIYISHQGNDLVFRGGWGTASSGWTTWNRVLTDQIFNSYAPTLTGTGASGTWGISITGSAANVGGYTANQLVIRPVNNGLNGAQRLIRAGFLDGSNDYSYSVMPTWDGTYWRLRGYNNADALHAETRVGQADAATRLNGPAYTNGTDGWFRSGGGATGWFNDTYNVGVYATEAGNVRTYNNSNLLANGLYPAYNTSRGFKGLTGSYGAVDLIGSNNGWMGIYLPESGGVTFGMYNAAGAGGAHDQRYGWQFYWEPSNGCLALGGSTTASGYKAYTNGNHYVNGQLSTAGAINAGSTVNATGFSTGGTVYGGYVNSGGNVNATNAFTGGSISLSGTATFGSNITTGGSIYGWSGELGVGSVRINGSSPTIVFQDSDNLSAFLHVNSNLIYFLRGSGTNSTGWDSGPNGRHPMVMNLVSGDVTFSGDVIAYSDRRMKTDIKPIEEPLAKIEKMNGVTFKKIESQDTSTGLIAQEVLEAMPEAVVEDADGMLSVKYGNLVGLLVEGIKALNKEVSELRAELKALKEQQ